MSFTVKINWQKAPTEVFTDNKYNRTHHWFFDGGIQVVASSAAPIIPFPYSNENAVDPEEALVAATSSCHMLWFLHLAATKNWVVENYEDNPTGILAKNERGKLAVTKITLNPKVVFGSTGIPTTVELEKLHQLAHENCFIANSLKTEIEIINQ